MNWEVVSSVSEFVAAIGVIASLIYVAQQMKASTLASSVESKLAMTEKMAAFQDLMIVNPTLNEIMITGRRGIGSLSKEDYLQFSNLALKASWFLSAGYFMHQRKAISDDDWHEFHSIAKYWSGSPGYQEWWEKQGKVNFAGKFRSFIESEIENARSGNQGT